MGETCSLMNLLTLSVSHHAGKQRGTVSAFSTAANCRLWIASLFYIHGPIFNALPWEKDVLVFFIISIRCIKTNKR
jgi:hypothetical protein